MVAVLGFSKEQIHAAVRDMYTQVATRPAAPLHFPVGREGCRLAGYTDEQLAGVPGESLESFAGVGCPFRAGVVRPGDTVLDVGAGSGTDALVASAIVGDAGKVYALDMTPAMSDKLEAALKQHGIGNVEILRGDAERIPLPDGSVDVVTSNGVLNLVPDKRRAISEIFRVLKPGGRVQIADIVIASPVTPDCEDDPKLWAECVVGATVDESYLEMFRDAGFENVEVLRDYDYFGYSPSEETRDVARQFGGHAFELRMRRGAAAPALALQWARRLDPRRAARNIQRRGLWGTISVLMAMTACYGTLGMVALLSALGVSIAVNDHVWAAAIVLFGVLAAGIAALGARKHGSWRPAVVAGAGALTLVYAMYVDYDRIVELIGFVLLAAGTWLDFDRRRWSRVPGGRQGARRRSGTSTADSPEARQRT